MAKGDGFHCPDMITEIGLAATVEIVGLWHMKRWLPIITQPKVSKSSFLNEL